MNLSGWWQALAYIIPLQLDLSLFGIYDLPREYGGDAKIIFQIVGFLFYIFYLVILSCFWGLPGQNKYGHNPLEKEVNA
ncbi:MAG: hypothetical protein JWM96_186 [Alphaproteobacteria bacterium]|nr:hypothetical protein [Alphaproteobacteria bacterium]